MIDLDAIRSWQKKQAESDGGDFGGTCEYDHNTADEYMDALIEEVERLRPLAESFEHLRAIADASFLAPRERDESLRKFRAEEESKPPWKLRIEEHACPPSECPHRESKARAASGEES